MFKWTTRAALILFWPGLALIVWGELTPSPPDWTGLFWDKALHFTAYFGLASMATMVMGLQRRTLWVLLGLAVLGGALEILQGYTGRDPDIYDELANVIGIASGALTAFLLTLVLSGRTLVEAPSAD